MKIWETEMSNNVTDIILIAMILEFINSTRIVWSGQ